MSSPRAVIIPFGVPDDGRGLGLGLAALVHSFAQVDGEGFALAQLLARRPQAPAEDALPTRRPTRLPTRLLSTDDREPGPVEAFVPPSTWRDLGGTGSGPASVGFVLTGAFEPPTDGRGLIQLLLFEPKNGRTRAKVEAQLDGDSAGKALIAAFEEVCACINGEIGGVREIGDLPWDALESVLRAERCALHDPLRGGPHDRLAAMMHLGRAIGDAPDSRYPVARLAALALDIATASGDSPKLAEAALRALLRASEDAPSSADLMEAIAALSLRIGAPAEAEERLRRALEIEPERGRLYALLSEARRSQGDLPGALAAIEDGLLRSSADPLLNTERGIVLAERGSLVEAEEAWRMVLDERPLYPPAFSQLAAMLMQRRDAIGGTRLVDQALAFVPAPSAQTSLAAHPEVLRRAIQLSLALEPDGLARAARISRLAAPLVERAPSDAWAILTLARALAQTGEQVAAVRRLAQVERIAPDSSYAAEAQRSRLAIEDHEASLEVDAVLRAAYEAQADDLETIAVRARKLAARFDVWMTHFAVGIAERRRARWRSAREAFTQALRVAPGCAPAHTELVGACVAVREPDEALAHARRAIELEGETARTLAVLATALLSAGKRDEATVAIDRALELDATDEANLALAERIRSGPAPRSARTLTRLRDTFTRWRKR